MYILENSEKGIVSQVKTVQLKYGKTNNDFTTNWRLTELKEYVDIWENVQICSLAKPSIVLLYLTIPYDANSSSWLAYLVKDLKTALFTGNKSHLSALLQFTS